MNVIATRRSTEPRVADAPRNRKMRSSTVPSAPRSESPPKLGRWARWRRLVRRAMPAARAIGRGATVLAGIAGAIALAVLVDRYVRSSSAFAVRDVRLEGHARLSRDTVLQAAGLAIGQNVFSLGPEDVEQRLRSHPWIRHASVERRLPGTFTIHIEERTAVALLDIEGLYLVSDDGSVFKAFTATDPTDLPVITGADRERFVRDRPYRTHLLLEIVAFLGEYRQAGLWRREPIGEIHIEPDASLSLYVGEDSGGKRPTHVRLGRAPFRGKLGKLRQVIDALAQRRERAAYVYLDNTHRKDRATVGLQ